MENSEIEQLRVDYQEACGIIESILDRIYEDFNQQYKESKTWKQ